MSEPLDAYVVIEGNKLDIQRVYLAADHIAALSAKDARIAELCALLEEIDRKLDLPGYYQRYIKDAIGDALASQQLAAQQQAEPVNFDLERMQKAVEGPFYEVSAGLSRDQLRELMLAPNKQPATHSEDGRDDEASESWAAALLEVAVVLEAVSSRDSVERLANMNAGETLDRAFGRLKSIRAQHSRIVAAKDAEIARLKGRIPPSERLELWQLIDEALTGKVEPLLRGDICNILAPLLVPLDAQPARQVGGDEREAFATWFCDRHGLPTGTQPAWGTDTVETLLEGWQARAALAPVSSQVGGDERAEFEAVVVSIARDLDYAWGAHCLNRDDEGYLISWVNSAWLGWCAKPRDDQAAPTVLLPDRATPYYGHDENPNWMVGYNFALDRVTRLNRRAIPEGLLERVGALPMGPEECFTIDRGAALTELRTLLGKEGE